MAKLFAYGLATAGSDWQEWKVCDVATGKDRPDALDWIKFSGASWMKDGSGFFYSRYDEPKDENKLRAQVYNQKLYFHKLGTAQAQDKLVYERPDHKDWLFSGEVTEDGHYLIIDVTSGNRSEKSYFLPGPDDTGCESGGAVAQRRRGLQLYWTTSDADVLVPDRSARAPRPDHRHRYDPTAAGQA